MRQYFRLAFLTATGLMISAAAPAQGIPGIGGGTSSVPGIGNQLPGGASGLVGQVLPNVSSAGTANTTGVLSYCVQNNYLQGDSASSVLSSLTGKSGVQSSSAFTAGQQGQLETGNGNMFSLSGLQDQAKSKLCNMVLQHAQSML